MDTRPRFIQDKHLLTLDFFKASGKLQNGNAITELQRAYPGMSQSVAMAIVAWWLTQKS
jgi:hypothetical protein